MQPSQQHRLSETRASLCRQSRLLLLNQLSDRSELKSDHSSFYLLEAHKHHNVPGAQTKKRRHESIRNKENLMNQDFFYLFCH